MIKPSLTNKNKLSSNNSKKIHFYRNLIGTLLSYHLIINRFKKYHTEPSKSKVSITSISTSAAFTIVELLVVIVVIGILAAITIVSYTGITSRANIAEMQSDLSNSSNQLKVYQTTNMTYPTDLNASYCPTAPVVDNNLCLKASPHNTYAYTSDGTSFNLIETNTNGMVYNVTDSTNVAVYLVDPWANWYPGVAATALAGKHIYKTDTGASTWTIGNPNFTATCPAGGRWPTYTELLAMYTNRASYGSFMSSIYWSSTAYDSNYAWVIGFNNGAASNEIKGGSAFVRCIAD
jgi:general secretion pathway protein G